MKRRFTIQDALAIKRPRDRAPIHLSRDGRLLAHGVVNPQMQRYGGGRTTPTGVPVSMEGSEVRVTDIDAGTSRNLTQNWGTSWSPRWSSDGDRLAFYSDRNGRPQLWLWERESDACRLLADASVSASYAFEVPRWTSDGRYVLTKLKADRKPDLPGEPGETDSQTEDPIVRVWKHIPSEEEYAQAKSPPWFKDRAEDLGLVNAATGEVHRLVKGINFNSFSVAPNDRAVAVLDWIECRIWVVPLDGTAPQCLAEDVNYSYGLSVSWSPDSRLIAYLNGEDFQADLCINDAETGQAVHTLEAGKERGFGNEYGLLLWSPDSHSCFCFGRRNLWEVSIETGEVRNLTENSELPVYNVLHRNGAQTIWLQGASYLYLQTSDSKTKRSGWCRLDCRTGSIDQLIEEDSFHWGWHDSMFHTDVSPQTNRVIYTAESAGAPPDLFISDLAFKSPRQIGRLNPEVLEFSFGESRLISWMRPGGKELRGTLLLPVGYEEGEHYPLITYIYPGYPISDCVYLFGVSQVETDNLQIFANQGYAVLAPDIPLDDGPPMPQVPDSVLSGIDYVIELGIADSRRLGIMGHSFGGSGVKWLVTQTTRFAAAVSAAGTCDLISAYVTLTEEGYSAYGVYEGEMGGTLWEQKSRYIENSPIFNLDKVETPLLLIVGADAKTDVLQAEEMFAGLRRLDREVVLAAYPGQGHSPSEWNLSSQLDYSERILSWFDEHLKRNG